MARYYSESEVIATVDGLTVCRLRAFVAANCVAPAEFGGRLTFAEIDVARLRLLEEVCDDFDVDEDSAALILRLVDQIHGLRHQLRGLGTALAEEPEDVRERIRARLLPDA